MDSEDDLGTPSGPWAAAGADLEAGPSRPTRAQPGDDPEALAGAAAEARLFETAEDHRLLRRAQAGEEAAFAELVARHERRAWRIARNLVGSDEDASDVAQEAFLRVFRNLAGFDFDHGFTTWLYRIVTNLAIDHLRRRRPAASTARHVEGELLDLELEDDDAPAPSSRLEADELAAEVQACLATLAPHFQSVLVLREIEGLPCNVIAEIVGATHVTVRWRLHRGRKLFQEEWERRARRSRMRGATAEERESRGSTRESEESS